MSQFRFSKASLLRIDRKINCHDIKQEAHITGGMHIGVDKCLATYVYTQQ